MVQVSSVSGVEYLLKRANGGSIPASYYENNVGDWVWILSAAARQMYGDYILASNYGNNPHHGFWDNFDSGTVFSNAYDPTNALNTYRGRTCRLISA